MDDFRKQGVMSGFFSAPLAESDPALAAAIGDELVRQQDQIEMIASENIVSPAVRDIVSSDLHGRYAEGLPGKRYYQGCDDFDTIESIGIDSAKRVFNCQFANIQSTSGTVSNMGALKALTKPGDTITAVSTADGGHISHHPMGAVGMRGLNLVTYPWDEERMEPDVDAASAIIRSEQPELCLFGQSVIPVSYTHLTLPTILLV